MKKIGQSAEGKEGIGKGIRASKGMRTHRIVEYLDIPRVFRHVGASFEVRAEDIIVHRTLRTHFSSLPLFIPITLSVPPSLFRSA